ncbi:hypothetical protein SPRG_02125 [Saprolegnia parasitica CBS 223.65]|uniref:Uncharacterized protein n=1 Tax=Saprolegnia parasitica (strain CBS 223.65) TaxID=695850 RepID=A0A067D3L2_SAPPC|nr:hypothetical protein SPRG_02125 [Saprolegnia parasitica CBS 223.65]KDO33316.1 hypothetical protein SPRG_02125 [Saprolegnia parasitica CBS 223.65]|eukprot:XP_012196066.1 hypothetical protein SPRG_02125 [Saprolegnia parasitica CBS 223.65]
MAPTRASKRSRPKEVPTAAVDAPISHGFSDDQVAAWKATLSKEWYFEAPADFFTLYAIAQKIAPEQPHDAFKASLGLQLTGPYMALTNAPALPTPVFLHGRCYYDPPEVITVVSSATLHLGYFRDAPKDTPAFVVEGANDTAAFEFRGRSLVDVLYAKLLEQPHGTVESLLCQFAPFAAATRETKRPRAAMCERKWTAPTLSGLGIWVPIHPKTGVGFRALPTQSRQLHQLLSKPRSKDVDDLLTRANIACDECEFGTALQLGLDLFAYRETYSSEAKRLLDVAYLLLKRGSFAKIVRHHLASIEKPSS